MAEVSREELDGMLEQLGLQFMQNVSREVEQRLKTEDFQRVLESTDMPDAWKQPVESSTELRDRWLSSSPS